MKGSIFASLLVTFVFAGPVLAGDSLSETNNPVPLTTTQMDQVTAGTGRDNVALQPWGPLFDAGFVPRPVDAAAVSVTVPRRP